MLAFDAAGDEAIAGPESFVPPSQIGIYRLDELIGAGGMGSVYRARRNDGLFEQTVAIKFIRPMRGLTEPLVDAERKLLARMEHPGIARILDGGLTENGLHFLVMEFVSGVALDQYAHERKLNIAQRVSAAARSLRRRRARSPESRGPLRHQARQHSGHGRRPAEADRFRRGADPGRRGFAARRIYPRVHESATPGGAPAR